MASFVNTEQVYSTSGVTGTWLASQPAFNHIRNSGGIVNIAGPILVKSILVVPASGRYQEASVSGNVLAVTHGTSGMFAQLSGQELFRFDGGAHSGLGTGNNVAIPEAPGHGLDFIARSGLVTLNSGLHIYDIIVTYANTQIA